MDEYISDSMEFSKFSNGIITTEVISEPDCEGESHEHSTPSSSEQDSVVPIVDCLLRVVVLVEQFSS